MTTKMPTVLDLVNEALRAGGYDGLYNPGECACLLDDLAPCGEIGGDCRAGYYDASCEGACGIRDDEHWHISAALQTGALELATARAAVSDDEQQRLIELLGMAGGLAGIVCDADCVHRDAASCELVAAIEECAGEGR